MGFQFLRRVHLCRKRGIVAGYCILSNIFAAVIVCNADPACIGYCVRPFNRPELLNQPPVVNLQANGSFYAKPITETTNPTSPPSVQMQLAQLNTSIISMQEALATLTMMSSCEGRMQRALSFTRNYNVSCSATVSCSAPLGIDNCSWSAGFANTAIGSDGSLGPCAYYFYGDPFIGTSCQAVGDPYSPPYPRCMYKTLFEAMFVCQLFSICYGVTCDGQGFEPRTFGTGLHSGITGATSYVCVR